MTGPSPFQATTAQGDKWMQQAVATYEGGGDFDIAAAEAAIATAWYSRAALERPDTFAALLAAAEQQQGVGVERNPMRVPRTRRPRAPRPGVNTYEPVADDPANTFHAAAEAHRLAQERAAAAAARLAQAEADLDASVGRHPAGKKRPAPDDVGFVEDTVPDETAVYDSDPPKDASRPPRYAPVDDRISDPDQSEGPTDDQ